MEKVDPDKVDAELDRVSCPEGRPRDTMVPARVWTGMGPDKKPVRRGSLPKHGHDFTGEDCPWTGHPADVIREEKKD